MFHTHNLSGKKHKCSPKNFFANQVLTTYLIFHPDKQKLSRLPALMSKKILIILSSYKVLTGHVERAQN